MENQARRNRKYHAFLLVFFINAVLLTFHRLSGEQFVNVTMTVSGYSWLEMVF
jgi:hypothetical protein